MKSLHELFRIGIGPSSSHTMGPQAAATLYLPSLYKETSEGGLAKIQK